MRKFILLAALLFCCDPQPFPTLSTSRKIVVDPGDLPEASGKAWDGVFRAAQAPAGHPDLSNQDDATNVIVWAKALVYAKTNDARYRDEVIAACMAAIGTEKGGRTLALGRELAAYVLSADMVGLPADDDAKFKVWLKQCLTENLDGVSLQITHEKRPNNWGTHAGANRVAVAVYLGDKQEVGRCATIFNGWLGDRIAYAGFEWGDLSWQADSKNPVGINHKGTVIQGYPVDGVLPDDQRRGGGFKWPPAKENYVYEALQGVLLQAIILDRQGYNVWNWQDRAIFRAFKWLNVTANFPATGDDTWQPWVVNYFYGTSFAASLPSQPGKNFGWTDYIYGSGFVPPDTSGVDTIKPPEPDTVRVDTVWLSVPNLKNVIVLKP